MLDMRIELHWPIEGEIKLHLHVGRGKGELKCSAYKSNLLCLPYLNVFNHFNRILEGQLGDVVLRRASADMRKRQSA